MVRLTSSSLPLYFSMSSELDQLIQVGHDMWVPSHLCFSVSLIAKVEALVSTSHKVYHPDPPAAPAQTMTAYRLSITP